MSLHQSRTIRIVSLLVSIGASAATSFADVIVSNLAEPLRSSTPIGNNPNPVPTPELTPWYWAAQSFVTDENEYQLQSVEAIVGDGSDDPAPVVVAELRADNDGEVGALITTLSAPVVSGPPAARTFIPDASVTLQPHTAYWVLLGVESPGDGTFFWSYAYTNDTTGPGSLFLVRRCPRFRGNLAIWDGLSLLPTGEWIARLRR
jgi:hypothetical protein